jgi:hypothetical protein
MDMTGVSLVQTLALIAMSVLGSGVIALVEFRLSSTGLCRTHRDAVQSEFKLPARAQRSS